MLDYEATMEKIERAVRNLPLPEEEKTALFEQIACLKQSIEIHSMDIFVDPELSSDVSGGRKPNRSE